MSRPVPLAQAERDEHGVTVVTVPAGTSVDLGRGWVAQVTQAGLDCDCGKGVLCPLNPQTRVSVPGASRRV